MHHRLDSNTPHRRGGAMPANRAASAAADDSAISRRHHGCALATSYLAIGIGLLHHFAIVMAQYYLCISRSSNAALAGRDGHRIISSADAFVVAPMQPCDNDDNEQRAVADFVMAMLAVMTVGTGVGKRNLCRNGNALAHRGTACCQPQNGEWLSPCALCPI